MPVTQSEVEKALWREMADLTRSKCNQGVGCHGKGLCCFKEACEMAAEFAREMGVTLQEASPKGPRGLPFLGPDGCVVPPHLRPICSLHHCQISSMGCFRKDQEATDRYFQLREELDRIMGERQILA